MASPATRSSSPDGEHSRDGAVLPDLPKLRRLSGAGVGGSTSTSTASASRKFSKDEEAGGCMQPGVCSSTNHGQLDPLVPVSVAPSLLDVAEHCNLTVPCEQPSLHNSRICSHMGMHARGPACI